MAQKRQISIGFTQEQHEWLARREKELGIPKAETVRRAISFQMERDEEHRRRLAARNLNTVVTL